MEGWSFDRKAFIGLITKHVQLTPQVKEILLTDECLLIDPVVQGRTSRSIAICLILFRSCPGVTPFSLLKIEIKWLVDEKPQE